MLRIPLITGVLAAVALAVAPGAGAQMLYDIEIELRHNVSWESQDEGYPDECRSWSKGSGSQSLDIRTKRPIRVELEILFGNPAITGRGGGSTFSAIVDRAGRWKSNAVPMTAKCWPCGPLSEFGECEEERPPKPFAFKCTAVKPIDPNASVSYQKTAIRPDLRQGLAVRAWVRDTDYFDHCPPTIGGRDVFTLQHEWPSQEWAKLPVEETNRIMELKRGRSLTVEATQTHMYAVEKDRVHRGTRCSAMPEITDGRGECAISDYQVKFTRIR